MYSIIYGTEESERLSIDELVCTYPDIHVMHGFFHSWFCSKRIYKLVEFMTDNFLITEDEVLESINHDVVFTKNIVIEET